MTALFNREKELIMETKEINLWEVVPAIALRGLTIFPNMIIHFDVSRQKSIIAVEQAMMQDQKIFLIHNDLKIKGSSIPPAVLL